MFGTLSCPPLGQTLYPIKPYRTMKLSFSPDQTLDFTDLA
jgi:hypothetical protein